MKKNILFISSLPGAGKKGFSLPEIMMALGVLTVVALPLIAMYSHTSRQERNISDTMLATRFALQAIDEIKTHTHAEFVRHFQSLGIIISPGTILDLDHSFFSGASGAAMAHINPSFAIVVRAMPKYGQKAYTQSNASRFFIRVDWQDKSKPQIEEKSLELSTLLVNNDGIIRW